MEKVDILWSLNMIKGSLGRSINIAKGFCNNAALENFKDDLRDVNRLISQIEERKTAKNNK